MVVVSSYRETFDLVQQRTRHYFLVTKKDFKNIAGEKQAESKYYD